MVLEATGAALGEADAETVMALDGLCGLCGLCPAATSSPTGTHVAADAHDGNGTQEGGEPGMATVPAHSGSSSAATLSASQDTGGYLTVQHPPAPAPAAREEPAPKGKGIKITTGADGFLI